MYLPTGRYTQLRVITDASDLLTRAALGIDQPIQAFTLEIEDMVLLIIVASSARVGPTALLVSLGLDCVIHGKPRYEVRKLLKSTDEFQFILSLVSRSVHGKQPPQFKVR